MIQLSIFDTEPHFDHTPLRYPNPQKADSLRLLADSMQRAIDSKLNPAIAAVASLSAPTSHDPVAIKIRAKERDIIGVDFPGYFPTPRTICEHMVKLAILRERMRVLEPSAGKGSICEAIEKEASVHLDVCEIQPTLAKILKLKGFNVIAANCFDIEEQYDRILLNPPFGRGEEVKHIRHAYERLLSGGRMVAIAPESITFRRETIYREFRQWLKDKCSLNEALPDGSFVNSDRPTSVRTRILVIEKQ